MSNYIMELRKLVGHRPLLQVGASVIVEDEQKRILLQLRRNSKEYFQTTNKTYSKMDRNTMSN